MENAPPPRAPDVRDSRPPSSSKPPPQLAARAAREFKMLATGAPPRVAAWPVGNNLTSLRAQIRGPLDTVYEGGTFDLDVTLPDRYPFEPPGVRFATPVHHPNIDAGGRICLDVLSLPPKGAWRPSLNIATVLASVRALLASPNGDDGVDVGVCHQYRHDRAAFEAEARAKTAALARPGGGGGRGAAPAAEPPSQPLAPVVAGRLQLKRPRSGE